MQIQQGQRSGELPQQQFQLATIYCCIVVKVLIWFAAINNSFYWLKTNNDLKAHFANETNDETHLKEGEVTTQFLSYYSFFLPRNWKQKDYNQHRRSNQSLVRPHPNCQWRICLVKIPQLRLKERETSTIFIINDQWRHCLRDNLRASSIIRELSKDQTPQQ